MNPLLKYGGIAVTVILLVYGIKGCTGGGVQEIEITEPPTGESLGNGKVMVKSAAEELRTVSQRLQDAQSSQDGVNTELQQALKDMRSEMKKSNDRYQELSDKVDNGELPDSGTLPKGIVTRDELEDVVRKLRVDVQGVVEEAKSYANGETRLDSRNPLTPNNGFIIGGAGEGSVSKGQRRLVWIAPADSPGVVDKGVLALSKASSGALQTADQFSEQLSNGAASLKTDLQPVPYATIPPDSTMIGAVTASRVLGRIPSGKSVENPMGFKIVVPKKTLIANGFDLPEIAHANVSGYAVGDYALKCARGYITRMTFVFEDGRISVVGQGALGGDGTNVLGVLTDVAGTECIPGRFVSDVQDYLTTTTSLGAIVGLAEGAAAAQTTTTQGSDGSSSTAPTGDQGVIIASKSLSGGLESAQAWLSEKWANTFDAILIEIDTPVNIEIKTMVSIDYDPTARKVRYANQAEVIEREEEEWTW